MSKSFFPLFFLPLLGFGCINVDTTASTEGGLWLSADAGETWTSTSLMPTVSGVKSFSSADMSVIVFDAADPDAMYAGTMEDGLLYSYDNGTSWEQPTETALREGRVRGIAVDPRDKCTIYVALSSRVMKSTDCNRTYDTETFVEGSSKIVRALELDWYAPDTVWIGTSSGDVLKSTNGGDTWTTVVRVGDGVTDVMVDGSDSRIILVTTEDKGIWRTADGGAEWTELEEELKEFKNSEEGYQLAQNSDGSMMYYASAYGLLRSTDHGATWSALTLVTASNSVRVWSLAVNPDNGNEIFYGTSTTFYNTTDGGENWATNELPSDRAATALAIDPDSTSSIFLGVARIEED